MPAYYTWSKNVGKYLKLADELWYAASGITVVNKTTFNVALGHTQTPLTLTHDQFLYAMKQEDHFEAAMIFEALIKLTDEATYIDHQISKNWRTRSSARILIPLIDATSKAVDMIIYDVYPKSREGFGAGKNWYTLKSPRPSKILQPTEITKRTIEEIRSRLWSIVSQTSPWGTRGYQRDVPDARNRMKYLIDMAISNAESAEKSAKHGDLLDAAVSLTHAIFSLDLYFQYRRVMGGKMSMKEFEEIDAVSENLFNSSVNAIIDTIGI